MENVEVCVLVKKEPHFFDRLTFNGQELAGNLFIDWVQWREVESPNDWGFEEYEEPTMEELNQLNFERRLENEDLAIIDIDFPWCNKCV